MSDNLWLPSFNQALDSWSKKFIITSPDIDGLLCAALLSHRYGARLIGVYTTSHLLLFDNFSREAAKEAIWVDHDISHPGIICMGQHLIKIEENDKLPTRHMPNFNPNLIWPVNWKNCFNGRQAKKVDKYPFATIHYMMKGIGEPEPEKYSKGYSLLAHADGTWVTSYDYPYNCNQWKDWMFRDYPGLINDIVSLTYADSRSLEVHLKVLEDLLSIGISKGRSRKSVSQDIPSEWKEIEGHQSIRFSRNMKKDLWLEKFNNIWHYISNEMNWKVNDIGMITSVISGNTDRDFPDRIIRNSTLDNWMIKEKVFSHAIIFKSTIRFTTGINL